MMNRVNSLELLRLERQFQRRERLFLRHSLTQHQRELKRERQKQA